MFGIIMCNCIDIEIGSYDNQILIDDLPKHMIEYRIKNGYESLSICIDRCISSEVIDLWNKGITTTGCCCGHNKIEGYIGVIDSDINKMKELGYSVAFNPNRPESEDSFLPKHTTK